MLKFTMIEACLPCSHGDHFFDISGNQSQKRRSKLYRTHTVEAVPCIVFATVSIGIGNMRADFNLDAVVSKQHALAPAQDPLLGLLSES